MALSKVMIIEGQTTEAMLKGDLKTSSGLGYIDHIITDTHFVKKGSIMECLGSGMVMIIIDGAPSRYTNIGDAKDKDPLSVENLTVHILTTGDGFLLEEKKFIPQKNQQAKTYKDLAQA